MSDFEINRSVAIAIGFNPDDCDIAKRGSPSVGVEWNEDTGYPIRVFDYCNNPADAWPIIIKSGINLFTDMIPHGLLCQARASITRADAVSDCIIISDKNPLRAAMIVFLMMQESANVQDNPAR